MVAMFQKIRSPILKNCWKFCWPCYLMNHTQVKNVTEFFCYILPIHADIGI